MVAPFSSLKVLVLHTSQRSHHMSWPKYELIAIIILESNFGLLHQVVRVEGVMNKNRWIGTCHAIIFTSHKSVVIMFTVSYQTQGCSILSTPHQALSNLTSISECNAGTLATLTSLNLLSALASRSTHCSSDRSLAFSATIICKSMLRISLTSEGGSGAPAGGNTISQRMSLLPGSRAGIRLWRILMAYGSE